MLKVTFCFELMDLIIKKNFQTLKLISSRYLVDGVEAEVEDKGFDRQHYKIIIKPKE